MIAGSELVPVISRPPATLPRKRLRAAFEGDELHVDIILRKEAHLVGDVRRNMNHVGRRDRHAKDNFSFGLRLDRRDAKAISVTSDRISKAFFIRASFSLFPVRQNFSTARCAPRPTWPAT